MTPPQAQEAGIDFEKARKMAHALLMVADHPEATLGHEAVMDVARAYLALLATSELRGVSVVPVEGGRQLEAHAWGWDVEILLPDEGPNVEVYLARAESPPVEAEGEADG